MPPRLTPIVLKTVPNRSRILLWLFQILQTKEPPSAFAPCCKVQGVCRMTREVHCLFSQYTTIGNLIQKMIRSEFCRVHALSLHQLATVPQSQPLVMATLTMQASDHDSYHTRMSGLRTRMHLSGWLQVPSMNQSLFSHASALCWVCILFCPGVCA